MQLSERQDTVLRRVLGTVGVSTAIFLVAWGGHFFMRGWEPDFHVVAQWILGFFVLGTMLFLAVVAVVGILHFLNWLLDTNTFTDWFER